MRLLNTHNRLPGGWKYDQFDATGKLLKKFQSFEPWMMFLQRIQSFRKLNHLVRQDINFVEADVTEFLARQFGGDPKYFTQDSAQKKTSSTNRYQSRSLAKLVDRGKQLLTGVEVLKDWLGDGLKPVAQSVAQGRADICRACPRNNPGFKPVETVAAIIRLWSEKKNEMTLSVTGEESLHTCAICWCDLKTKVHVPQETIFGQTPDAMFDKFETEAPQNCWMRRNNPA